jgi:hypothetical protein
MKLNNQMSRLLKYSQISLKLITNKANNYPKLATEDG